MSVKKMSAFAQAVRARNIPQLTEHDAQLLTGQTGALVGKHFSGGEHAFLQNVRDGIASGQYQAASQNVIDIIDKRLDKGTSGIAIRIWHGATHTVKGFVTSVGVAAAGAALFFFGAKTGLMPVSLFGGVSALVAASAATTSAAIYGAYGMLRD